MHENQEIKNCPKCLDKQGTLVELEYARSKKKFYYCTECTCSFDYNDQTPCCGTHGTMIDLKGAGGMNHSVRMDHYCLSCGCKIEEHK